MPAWLLAASGMLRTIVPRLFFGTRLRTAATVGGGALAIRPGGALDPVSGGAGFLGSLFGGGDGGGPRRRRRRRALTQSDRNDIAFIAATIGKAAAGSFAVQLATRSR